MKWLLVSNFCRYDGDKWVVSETGPIGSLENIFIENLLNIITQYRESAGTESECDSCDV